MGWEGKAGFGSDIGLRNVAYNTGGRGCALVFTRVMGENNMDGGSSAPELGVLDGNGRRAGGGSTEEFEMECDAVRLLVGGEGGVEVELRRCEDVAGYDTAVRYAADCPGVVKEDGIGPGIEGFHGVCFGECGHCVRTPANSTVLQQDKIGLRKRQRHVWFRIERLNA